MSAMDMFKSILTPNTAKPNTATPVGNIQESTAAALQSTATAGTAVNGVVPASTDVTEPKSPLDQFTDMWKTDDTNSNQAQPLFNIDQAALLKTAQTQDFTKLIKPEQLQAVLAGGEGAANALLSVLNTVAQDNYARSAFATTKLIEGALGKNNKTLNDSLPNLIKQHNVSNGLREENPAFSHPAVQPMIQALESQMIVKFPDATAAELRKMATDYIGALPGIITQPTNTNSATGNGKTKGMFNAAPETDWSSFLQ